MKAVRHIARIGVIAACASVTGCFNVSEVSEPAAGFTSKGAAVLHPNFGCSLPPTLDPTDVNFLAGDITSPFVQQVDVDCFAWQSFIALNWPVDARWPGRAELAGEPDRSVQAKDWGTPQDPTKVALRAATWETYKPVQDIFVPPGETPSAWGVLSAPPSMCAGAPSRLKSQARTWRVLTFTSKLRSSRQTRSAVGANAGLRPDEINQVVGGWLTDQNRNLVWYSRAVNRAEFEYLLSPDGVSADALYRQAGQRNVATDGNGRHPAGLSFPVGQRPQGAVQPWSQRGATEIKSAWRILTDLPRLWPRYHLAQAWLVDPETKQCGFAVLGLVGLHIVRSTATFPNFFWATF